MKPLVKFPLCGCIGLALSFLGTDDATADAFARGEGNSFLSFGYQAPVSNRESREFGSLFYEYGLSPELTIGLDAGFRPGQDDQSAVIFLRRSIFESDAPDKFAAELGVGVANSDNTAVALLRPGLSWGRGLQNGWVGAVSSYSFRSDGGDLAKLDVTRGFNHAGGSLSIFQIQSSKPSDGKISVSLVPSYVKKLSENVFFEVGANYSLTGDPRTFKLGLWFSN
ncbi:MAG: hypothetical protein WBG95_16040 [Sulfitobacter sp.]